MSHYIKKDDEFREMYRHFSLHIINKKIIFYVITHSKMKPKHIFIYIYINNYKRDKNL